MISRLTPPTQLTFLASVALAIIAVVARVLGYMGIQMPMFPTGGVCAPADRLSNPPCW